MLNKSNAFKFRQANSANQVEEAPKANPNADSRNEEIEAQRIAFMKVNPDFDMATELENPQISSDYEKAMSLSSDIASKTDRLNEVYELWDQLQNEENNL